MRKWNLNQADEKAVNKIIFAGLAPLAAQVLVGRGYETPENINEKFAVGELCSPTMLKDMREAVAIISEAIEDGRKICVYGDYDCDGIASTVMLYSFLEMSGANAVYHINERDEGYGMNGDCIRRIYEDGTKLIITVDNGISAIAESDLIYELGMELIVTDHHQPGEVLPRAAAIVNPHRQDDASPFKPLCGAGIALKLIAAMQENDYDVAFEQCAELAALATVADIVKLEGENRLIVKEGLRYIENTENLGLLALMEVSGMKTAKAVDLAFKIAPRINAAKRMGSPKDAARLLLTDNEEEAATLSERLNALNTERKSEEERILESIKNRIYENPKLLNERVLIFAGDDFHHGVIGLAASKLLEKFGKPAFVLSGETKDGITLLSGSARSFGTFSIYKCLDYCKELFEKHGGHEGAGGFTLKSENLAAFREKVAEYAKLTHSVMPIYELNIDKLLTANDLTLDAVNSLSSLEPFGEGNPPPLFLLHGAKIKEIRPSKDGKHTNVFVDYGGINKRFMIFNTTPSETSIKTDEYWDFVVSLEIGNAGYSDVDLRVKEYRKSGVNQEKYFAAFDAYEKYIRGEELPKPFYIRMTPSRNELILIYKELSKLPQNIDSLFVKLEPKDINYCKLRISIDVFTELKLCVFDAYNQTAALVENPKKVNLSEAEILKDLANKSV